MVNEKVSGRWVLSVGLAVLVARGGVACDGESVVQGDGDGRSGTGGSAAAGGGNGGSGATNGGAAGRGGVAGDAGAGGDSGAGGDGGASGDGGDTGGSAGSGGSAGMGPTTCVGGPPLEGVMDGPRVQAGTLHTCYLKRDGTITCWGANEYSPGFEDEDVWVGGAATPPSGAFVRLATRPFSCAIDAEGNPACWGNRLAPPAPLGPLEKLEPMWPPFGMCGLCTSGALVCSGLDVATPTGLFDDVTAGLGFGCALTNAGRATCFGGELFPAPTAPSTVFQQISAGDQHVCGMRPNGTIDCWGSNGQGQATAPAGTYTDMDAGGDTSCALVTDGSVTCWGRASPAPTGNDFVQVSVGTTHACGVHANDRVECWGSDAAFQSKPPPEIAWVSETFLTVSVAGQGSINDEETDEDFNGWTGGCGIRSDNSLSCWGGLGSWRPSGQFVVVDVGYGSACAIDSAEALVCTGVTLDAGETLPTGTFRDVSQGSYFGCTVRSNGELACWDGDEYDVVTTPPAGAFTAVSVHDSLVSIFYPEPETVVEHACALRSDGAAHCFGYGTGTTERIVDDDFVEIRAGARDCARREDGTVVCWSGAAGAVETISGTFRRIGSSTTFLRENGTVFATGITGNPAGRTLIELASASDFSCGIDNDGYVRCFGARVR